MYTQETLRLLDRLELSHPSLSHPGCLMGLLCPVVGILGIIMDNIRHQLSMRNAIAPQFVSHDLSGLVSM